MFQRPRSTRNRVKSMKAKEVNDLEVDDEDYDPVNINAISQLV